MPSVLRNAKKNSTTTACGELKQLRRGTNQLASYNEARSKIMFIITNDAAYIVCRAGYV